MPARLRPTLSFGDPGKPRAMMSTKHGAQEKTGVKMEYSMSTFLSLESDQ